MGGEFNAGRVLNGSGPLYDRIVNKPRLGQRIFDPRVTLSSDPNDPDGGYLPFNPWGWPLVPMTWVGTGGVFENIAYETELAASMGVTPANDPPRSLRMSGGPTTVEEMIANCKLGIYVNRFSHLSGIDESSGAMTGLTNGGCYLVRNGKIEKSVRHFRFIESPWHFLNRVEAIGSSERTAFGYAPWQEGGWPVAPTIVPPLMIRDFNFGALSDAV
jgi:predicted Zn-dependent protease